MANNNISKQQNKKNTENKTDKEFLSVREVAALSGYSYGTVKRAIEQGRLDAYRIGRKFFIDKAAAEEYCRAFHKQKAAGGYTIRELMSKLSLSYAFVSELIKSGELKSSKIGRQYIISEADFQEFMQKKRL